MKNPNAPPPRPSAAGKPPTTSMGAPARKSRWGPPPPGAAGAAPAGDKAAPSTSAARTPTPTQPADTRRHPAPPAPRNPASPAVALRPQPPAVETPPPPPYGFHNLDRRTVLLADGTVRTYFALPHDYPFDSAPLPPHLLPRAGPDLWQPPHQPQMPMPMQMPPHEAKRNHPADQDEGFPRRHKQLRLDEAHHPPQPPPQAAVDRHALMKAFLKYAKTLNESSSQKRRFLEGGRVPCLSCGRFGDPTSLAALFLASFLVSFVVEFLCWFLAIVELTLIL